MTPSYIIIHHSLTKDNVVKSDFDAIKRYHMQTNGWRDIGYHWILEKVNNKWKWTPGRKENDNGAHCKEEQMNYKSIGICVVGNFDVEIPTQEIYQLVADKCKELMKRYPAIKAENIQPHRKYATYKSCPGKNFDTNKVRELVVQKPKQPQNNGLVGEKIQGEAFIKLNDKQLKNKAIIINGVSYLPIREIAELFNAIVDFDNNTKTILIRK